MVKYMLILFCLLSTFLDSYFIPYLQGGNIMESIKMEQGNKRKETILAEKVISLLLNETFSVDIFNAVFSILTENISSPKYLNSCFSILSKHDDEDIQCFLMLSSLLNKILLIHSAEERVESLNLLRLEFLRISEEYLTKASSSFEVFVYSSILRNESDQYGIIAEVSIRRNTPKFFSFVMDLIKENALINFSEFYTICKIFDKNSHY